MLLSRETRMGKSSFVLWKLGVLVFLALVETSSATLSPTGINYEGSFPFLLDPFSFFFCARYPNLQAKYWAKFFFSFLFSVFYFVLLFLIFVFVFWWE